MTVEPSSAAAKRVYEGETIYFCAKGCAEAFDKAPKRYLGQRGSKMISSADATPSPQPSPGGRGGKQPALFEIKGAGARSAFLRKPPVKGAPLDPSAPPPLPATSRVALAIEGMHCASCVATIEEALSGVTGVTAASVNLATGRARVVGRGLNPRRLIEAVRTRGYEARPAIEAEPGATDERAARELRAILYRTLAAAALTLPVLVISMADIRFPSR